MSTLHPETLAQTAQLLGVTDPEEIKAFAERGMKQWNKLVEQNLPVQASNSIEAMQEMNMAKMRATEEMIADLNAMVEEASPGVAWRFWKNWVEEYPEADPTITDMFANWETYFPKNLKIRMSHDPWSSDVGYHMMLMEEDRRDDVWLDSPIPFEELVPDESYELITPQSEQWENFRDEVYSALNSMGEYVMLARIERFVPSSLEDLEFRQMPDDHPAAGLVFQTMDEKDKDIVRNALIAQVEEEDFEIPSWYWQAAIAWREKKGIMFDLERAIAGHLRALRCYDEMTEAQKMPLRRYHAAYLEWKRLAESLNEYPETWGLYEGLPPLEP